MLKWVGEWVIVSLLLVLLLGMAFLVWVMWPLLLNRLAVVTPPVMDPQGIFALLMLLVVLAGFAKLLRL
ncbi:MAG: hypothetical protein ACP5GX_05925 [Anaerolineae bacterium]